jgi:hypothetical protein
MPNATNVETLESQLLNAIPPSGSIGNITLLKNLGWPEEQYWSVRDDLIRAGTLEAGRGRGGSVRRRIVEVEVRPVGAMADRETALYTPILATLKRDWAQDYRYTDFEAEITAHQGRRDTGGKWSRPDVTLVTCDTYQYVPGKHLDVITFEIKRYEGLDVTSIYEALAHRRAAHYAYVLVQVPEAEFSEAAVTIEELSYAAEEHGIGLVTLAGADDYKTWAFLQEADRNDPDPADVNEFIDDQLSIAFKERISRWLR